MTTSLSRKFDEHAKCRYCGGTIGRFTDGKWRHGALPIGYAGPRKTHGAAPKKGTVTTCQP